MKDKKPKLTWAQYWEWRTTIAEMNTAKSQVETSEAQFQLLCKDAEMMRVRAELFARVSIDGAKSVYDEAQKEYVRFKKVLEDSLGTSLNGKLIDETTLEIKDLPDETK